MAATSLRLAALADLHCTRTARGAWQPLLAQAAAAADVLLLCGDLTDHGLPEEAEVLAGELRGAVQVPVLGVLGNHDYEAGQTTELRDALTRAGITLLDDRVFELRGVGFAGATGFMGGFGQWALEPWGEPAVKALVRAVLDEALKLEVGLSRLRTKQRVAVLHYAPIQATVEGEPREVFPFLGSSRLEEPLNRFPVVLTVHGHAHHGSPEGRTQGGAPVYNVSVPVLRRAFPERPPFRLLEVPVTDGE
jgi:Icc-related predicted phosphoesterase